MQATPGRTVPCPACGETNRAEASFCRACAAAVASHANAYTWVSRIATAFALVSLATVGVVGFLAVASRQSYNADEWGAVVIIAGIVWFASSLVGFTFGGWSAAGLRARRSWGTVIAGMLSRLMFCAILMILGGIAMEYACYYRRYRSASNAAREYRQQLEENKIKPKDGYWYY